MNTLLNQIQQEEHSNCILCGQNNEKGLKLDFMLQEDGGVEAYFRCTKDVEGYRNILHGGVVSALLDAAMTNCLFAHGIRALTADLKVRFLVPVDAEGIVQLRARIQRAWARFYILKSELFQNDVLKATGQSIFVRLAKDKPDDK
ncbi:MAG: PaaI family thioesterase [Candidatus Omnitrophica bacterium]|nr:PaaI family thioesterase [Candidatus Omnitrophota bacterium]MDD5670330.1 PaaI family thioesterase [Candidatus Omnitrophota bacterium]